MKIKSPCFLTFILQAILFVLSSVCQAQSVTLMPPDDWPSENWMPIVFGTPSIKSTFVANYQWLEIARMPGEVGSGQVVYTGGEQSASDDNQFSDLTGSVIIRGTMGPDGGGVILRAASSKWGESQRYYIAVMTNYLNEKTKEGGGLGIYTVEGDAFLQQDGSQALALKDASVERNKEYKLLFSAIGSVLKATLYQFNPVSGEFDQEITSVQINNAKRTAAGWVGLRGGRFGSDSTFAQFRNFEIQRSQPSP